MEDSSKHKLVKFFGFFLAVLLVVFNSIGWVLKNVFGLRWQLPQWLDFLRSSADRPYNTRKRRILRWLFAISLIALFLLLVFFMLRSGSNVKSLQVTTPYEVEVKLEEKPQ